MPSDGTHSELSEHREWPRGTAKAADSAATSSAIEALSDKVEQLHGQVKHLNGQVEGHGGHLSKFGGQVSGVDSRIDHVDTRLSEVDKRVAQVDGQLAEIKDMVEALVDSLDSIGTPVTSEQVEQHLGRHTERLAAETGRLSTEGAQRHEELTKRHDELNRRHDQLDKRHDEFGRRHDELTGHIQTGFSSDRTVALQQQVAQLNDDQRKLHDLVEAVADGLESPQHSGPAKLEAADKEALHDLSARTTTLEGKINDLAQVERSVSETIQALRKEVTELSHKSSQQAQAPAHAASPLDEHSISSLANAVAKRLEQGPSS